MSISSYYTAFKRLWDEYFVLVDLPKCSACGVVGSLPQLFHTLQNIQFLVGLNDDYIAVRTNILMMKPVPTLAEVYQIVLQDEGQRELKSNPTVGSDSTALNSYQKLQGNSSSRGPSFQNSGSNSGGRGSSSQTQGGRGGGKGTTPQDRRSMYFCDHCKMQGHTIDRCFKIHGYPNQRSDSRQPRGNSFSGNTDATGHSGSTGDSRDQVPNLTREQYSKFYCFNSSKGMEGWIIDSGATHHITPNLSLFSSYEALSTHDFITMPDGSQSQITHVGTVTLNDQYVLRNVLCVPGFTFNLLSVSQFSKDLSLMDRSMKASQLTRWINFL
ncbi:hypothetical protein V2J09_010660 [Rumex salicifolius]